ncbi:hypothetical protein BDR03DRAFT_937958, partial [Suillus americanus]
EFACDSRACALLQNFGYTADSGYISTAPLPTCFPKSGSYSCRNKTDENYLVHQFIMTLNF